MLGFGPLSELPISAVPGSASGPTPFTLPNPATLHKGRRAHYRFMVQVVNGIRVSASNSATIRIAANISVANGNILAVNKGDTVHLAATTDSTWEALSELPEGSWTVT